MPQAKKSKSSRSQKRKREDDTSTPDKEEEGIVEPQNDDDGKGKGKGSRKGKSKGHALVEAGGGAAVGKWKAKGVSKKGKGWKGFRPGKGPQVSLPPEFESFTGDESDAADDVDYKRVIDVATRLEPLFKPHEAAGYSEEESEGEEAPPKKNKNKRLSKGKADTQPSPPPSSPPSNEEETALFTKCFLRILQFFSLPKYRSKYGCHPGDLRHLSIPPTAPVPSYFANVIEGSIYERKLLSILGLRNLIYYGFSIYGDLREQQFRSNYDAYAEDAGVHLMRRVTGNAVDLDTVVLRCSDGLVLKTVNAMNKKDGAAEYRCGEEFGESVQAKEMAVTAAVPLLKHFCKALKLGKQQRAARRVEYQGLTQRSIPLATHNADRGNAPLWHYVNVGQNSFHANVPNLPDVAGSLLAAPHHLAAAFATIMLLPRGAERDALLDAFFEDAVVDACFNLKWKAIEEFRRGLAARRSIGSVLGEVQRVHQDVFSRLYDTTPQETVQALEVRELWNLVQGSYGKDMKSGNTRAITRCDVEAWVINPQSVE